MLVAGLFLDEPRIQPSSIRWVTYDRKEWKSRPSSRPRAWR